MDLQVEDCYIFDLHSDYGPCGDQPQAIKNIVSNFKDGVRAQTLLGVTGSGKTFTMAHTINKLGKKTLVLAHNKTLAAQLYAEFKDLFPNNAVEYFVSYYDYYRPEAYVPGTDTYVEKDAAINDEIDKLRHSATRSLLERDDVIVIASVSCIYGIGDPVSYESLKIILFVGDEVDRDEFLLKLANNQYERNDVDFFRGSFRVRGDTVEIFPAHEDSNIIRVVFFGDEIESITICDPLRGGILKTLDKVVIYPKSHYVVESDKMDRAVIAIKEELRNRINSFEEDNKLVEKQRIENRTLLDLEMMEEIGYCQGIENYSRHLTGRSEGESPPTLIDYFGDEFLLIIDESHMTVSQVGGMYHGDRSRKQNLVDYGFRLPSALDNRPLNFKEFENKIDQVLYVSATPGDYELKQTGGEYVEQVIRPTGLIDPEVIIKDATNQVDDVLIEAKTVIKRGDKILITTLTKKMSERLTDHLISSGMRVRYLHSDIKTLERMEIIRDLRMNKFDILVGINLLREGLDIPEVSLVAILDADKEGFLRSERSLIQTMGRAARNINGKVILYAYKETKSIAKAMSETARRREIQLEHNKKNNITPKSIKKKITGGVIETLRGVKTQKLLKRKDFSGIIDSQDIDKRIIELKDAMKMYARNLEFEKAAQVRDEIKELVEARCLF